MMMNKNKTYYIKSTTAGIVISFFFVLLVSAGIARAETIRLKDGQVINGQIVRRSEYSLVIKTPYQTRRIPLYDVKSIDKEDNRRERIYIYTINREVISGYLVEQDSLQVQYTLNPDDKNGRTISKLDILQMSSDEIRPVDLALGFRTGVFCPLNTGGAKLGIAPMFTGTVGISSMAVRYLRIFLETGYTSAKNSDNQDRRMQIVPVTLNGEYRYTGPWKIEISPRLGLGLTMADYNSGENDRINGTVFTLAGGLKILYPVRVYRFYAGLFTDYYMLTDMSGVVNATSCGLCLEYRL